MALCLLRALALVALLTGTSARTSVELRANPIRRVVSMLQMMGKKIEAEGETETELFDKFMCYCKTGVSTLKKDVADAEEKLPQMQSEIEEVSSTLMKTEAEHKKSKADRVDAEDTLSRGKALREKEAQAFGKESQEASANIAAIGKAVEALEKGMGGAFLQTGTASVVRRLVISRDMTDSDRDILSAFLAEGSQQEYAPAGGEIVGILKQMDDTMRQELQESIAQEEASITSFGQVQAAKTKEIAALTAGIEKQAARIGDLSVRKEELTEEIADMEAALEENKKFLLELEQNCGTKKQEWELRQKMRTEELIALADTIKMLNDDDALDLFKKTLPGPKLFLQVQVSEADVKKEALSILRAARSYGGRTSSLKLDLIALALRGKKVGFEKVIQMIDDMVSLLKSEQASDDDKAKYCTTEIDKTEDESKAVALEASDLGKAIDSNVAATEALVEELDTLMAGIKTLDKQVAEATETRKEEHEESVKSLQENNAAKELIEMAKNRLNKFYNKKLYKKPSERVLSESDRVTQAMGGTLAPTAAPGGIAGTGIVALVQLQSRARRAPLGPAPEVAMGGKKTEEATGVIAMMDMLKADLEKQIQEGEHAEAEAQAAYEAFIKDSQAKRTQDAQSIADKSADKAKLEEELAGLKKAKEGKVKEALALADVLKMLHGDCDWLLANLASRKEARAGEVEALQKAKSVLSGADYS